MDEHDDDREDLADILSMQNMIIQKLTERVHELDTKVMILESDYLSRMRLLRRGDIV